MISIYDSAVNAFVLARDRHDFAEATRFAQDVVRDLPQLQRRVLRIMYFEARARLFCAPHGLGAATGGQDVTNRRAGSS